MQHSAMQKSLIKLLIACFIVPYIGLNPSYAIKEASQDATVVEQILPKPICGKINFDDISRKAQTHSYDIQLADFEFLISKQGIRGARSEYFPKLAAVASTEYTKNFRDLNNSIVTTVGDSFINPYTRFQSLFGITLSYNIFDFGIKRNNLDIAKEDADIKELLIKSKFQDLDLTLIDTYSRLLMTQRQIALNNKILKLEQENLTMKERLLAAKEISAIEVNQQRVLIKNTEQQIFELKAIAEESLNWIAFYTGDKYELEELKVADFKNTNFDPMKSYDYTQSILWQIQEKELKKKELALKVAKKAYLPKVNAYGRYYLYGSDHTSYSDALRDFSPSNYTIGASVIMPVFDGFQTSVSIQKAELDLKKQFIERDKAIAELMNKLSIMRSNLLYLEKQVVTNKEAIQELQEKEKSQKRLLAKKIISPIELNDTEIELLKQQIEYEKNSVTVQALQKGIQTLTM